MKKITFILVALVCSLCTYAQKIEVDYTDRIVNAHFDTVAPGIHFTATINPNYPKHPDGTSANIGNRFSPIKMNYSRVDTHLEFYGWKLSDWGWLFKGSDGVTNLKPDGTTDYKFMGIFNDSNLGDVVTIAGNKNCIMPEIFEFYQIIEGLPAGDYKVTGNLGVQNNYHTSQRLFANNHVQFYGRESDYAQNKTVGEIYTYAGYNTSSDGAPNSSYTMTVYVTIGENEPLKIGVRSGNKKGDGSQGVNQFSLMNGFFKCDNFTLTKITDPDLEDPNYANLESLSVTGATLEPAFDTTVTQYTCRLPQGTTLFPGSSIVYTTLPNASATIDKQIGVVDLTDGSDVFKIAVTSYIQTVSNIYTITFNANTVDPITNAVDYTNSIINNDFDRVTATVPFSKEGTDFPTFFDGSTSFSSGWRPVKEGVTKIDNHLEFYGWQLSDWNFLFKNGGGGFIKIDETSPNQSIGINAGVTTTHGAGAWINGHNQCVMPENFEFYQTVNNLPAGTYRLSCLMGVQAANLTSQRLFANNNVQFFGKEEIYTDNAFLLSGETKTYAGYTGANGADDHKEMNVYVTIGENEPLKIGVRSGNKKGDGSVGTSGTGNMHGWVKFDNFRLFKLSTDDATDATLSDIALSVGAIADFSPTKTSYNVALPIGTTAVAPSVTNNLPDVKISGVAEVDVTAGSGRSLITVTALDGTTTRTYTINYTVGDPIGIDERQITKATYSVNNNTLTISGADYTAYDVNGVKIANKTMGASIELVAGVYIIKTSDSQTFKVVIE